MEQYTQTQLENKVSKFNKQLNNNFLTKSEKIRIKSAINYYINLLVKFDENPNLKSIKA